MKISDLFFKYIKDKHLERKGVTAEDLAFLLEKSDFVVMIDSENCDWTEKARDRKFKREFWKVIDGAKPSIQSPFRSLLPFLCLVLFGLGSHAFALQKVPELVGARQTHLLRLDTGFPILIFSDLLYHPYQRIVSCKF